MVRRERTEWRDMEISKRHRSWGTDCPAVDIDFLLLEFDHERPAAIIEYKHIGARKQRPSDPSYCALRDLATNYRGNGKDGIPFFATRYSGSPYWREWNVIPLNDQAKFWVPARKLMSEEEFVTLHYHMRGRKPPRSLIDWLRREFDKHD